MKKVLVIVDPQNDFITGSLAVKGAKEKMEKLTEYLSNNLYNEVMITMDTHPSDHCSFVENGGQWPTHCVTLSNGWDIPEYLENLLDMYSMLEDVNVTYWSKGVEACKEEYSILENEDDGYDFRVYLEELDIQESIEIHLCGIAGDYCVLETLKGLNKLFDNITVLSDYTASIDGGVALNEYISKHSNIKLV